MKLDNVIHFLTSMSNIIAKGVCLENPDMTYHCGKQVMGEMFSKWNWSTLLQFRIGLKVSIELVNEITS